ncbi:MAG: chaperone modulator CbpM [Deltaproteobacteria bacterium]|nr:chaperone modulator CbpM [Deltaproteobacteria bacterium]
MASRRNKRTIPIRRIATRVSAQELCRAYGIEYSFLISMIEYGIIEAEPHRDFDTSVLTRIGRAVRLHRDLQVNPAGIAVILDLLEELESVNTRLSVLERLHNYRNR